MDNTERNGLLAFFEDHPKTTFWIRFVFWFLFSCGLPVAFIIWRFDLYQSISKIHVGGWGIIIIAIVAFFIFTIIRYVKLAFSGRYSLLGQLLNGICKIILPLLVLYGVLYYVKSEIDLMLQAVGCIIICELIGIPVNPLPKWAYDMQKDVRDSEKKDTVDYLLTEFFRRKKEDE